MSALSHVTMSVRRGEIVGLIGPNGAGKTTLVNAVSGFARLSGGSLRLNGREISSCSPERRAHLGLARTFQHGRLFTGLTVRENIELGALAVGCSARTAASRTADLLEELGLGDFGSSKVEELSHGDQQRVGVARAVVAEPVFLLLDEPAAGLPSDATEDLAHLVRQARASRETGVVVIDHNVEFVLGLSDRVVVLDHGEVLAEGDPSAIRTHAEVMAAYFGSAMPSASED